MKGKNILLILALIVVIGGGTVLYNALKDTASLPDLLTSPSGQQAQNLPPDEEDIERIKAPDFAVEDAGGNEIKLSDMLGKPIVLNFWASWCPPCKGEMPDFDLVFAELGDNIQFMMVDAVDGSRETKAKGAAYIAEQGFTFPVFYDTNQDAVRQYGIRAFPTSIFIDSEGYIITAAEGAISEEALRKGIDLIK
ncbi:MAG: TlpA family protein disulfide reductase [Clostridiales bacterium]|nr:TlpA family protein disulfide reductase [Clostridiales bacterium]